jgi:shikimate dehydrogenase
LKRLAVLGHPVAHSRSPAMQNAALAELGLADEWSYEAIDVAPDDLADRIAAMEGEGFAGANVTVPHKQDALVLSNAVSYTI